MKAAQFNDYGDASVLQVTDVEKPTISEGKVLVKVQAASLNPFDTMVRAGYLKDMIPLTLPVTIGGDIAGTVAEVGDGVTGLAAGDVVYGQANIVAGNSGAFAEFALTSATQVAKAPTNVNIDEAGSLPLIGASALEALEKHIKLQPGQKVFIHGGSGAIGGAAVQIAKNIGAYVATTATGDGVEEVKALGADQVIDYKAQDFTTELADFDAVFDTVGGDDFNKSFQILKQGGMAVSMVAQADEAAAKEHGITATTQMTNVNTEVLNTLRDLVESGVVTPRVGKVFTLDQVQDAFTARETGSVKGKVVLHIQD